MHCRTTAGQHASPSCAAEKTSLHSSKRPAHLRAPRVFKSPLCVAASREDGSQTPQTIGRRSALQAAALSLAFIAQPHLPTAAARGFDQYIKRKQLDPLITYVPLVLEAKLQLQSAGNVIESDTALAKSLLREGAFSGLRDNIRAIGEYAQKEGRAEDAAARVTGFFKSLEVLDLVLSTSIRTGAALDVAAAREAQQGAEAALDGVIAMVPDDVLQQGQQVLDVVLEKMRAAALDPDSSSEDMEDLASLLS